MKGIDTKVYSKVKAFIDEYGMLEGIDTVILGLSGGGDSVCLLLMLKKYLDEKNINGHKIIKAVHIHHGIRGAEADSDAGFCRSLCEKEDITYYEYRFDIKGMAEKEHLSEEEMGRKIRYESFRNLLPEKGRGVIAVAHHKNDQAETVLFNLIRGSYSKGVRGMEPVNGQIIRPLLGSTKEEIDEWLISNEIRFCTDSTNLLDGYSRNKIRNKVIPYLEENINSETVNNLCRFAANMSEIESLLCELAESAILKYYKDGILLDGILSENIAVQKKVCYEILAKTAGARDLENKHIEYLLSLFNAQCGRKIDLLKGISAKRIYSGINISGKTNNNCESIDCVPEYDMQIRSVTGKDKELICNLQSKKNDDHYTKYFDYDKIIEYTIENDLPKEVEVRHRKSGDFIIIDDKGHKKTIKSLFIDEKIEHSQRDSLWLYAVGNHVLFIPGIRRTEDFFVTDETDTFLIISLKK